MHKVRNEKIKCENCGDKFQPRSNRQKYCGSRKERTGCSFSVKKERTKQYLRDTKDHWKEYKKKYSKNNRNKINKRRREKYIEDNGPLKQPVVRSRAELLEMARIRSQRYYKKNRERIMRMSNDRHKKRIKNDLGYRLKTRMRYRMWMAITGKYKKERTLDLIGCSIDELVGHLESQFIDGMTWDNYGRGGWVVDHIIPLSSGDLSDHNTRMELCNYKNLQPLWELDNIKKSNKMV